MTKVMRQAIAGLCIALFALPALGLIAPDAQAQTGGESYLVLYGETGDYITQGNDIFHAESTDIQFSPTVNYDNGISVAITVSENGTFAEHWSADFAAPNEVPLAAGDEFAATRFPFQATDVAGLSVSGDGRGCNTVFGEFAVRELTIGADGEVENFAADFRQTCGSGPSVVGGIRINSTLDNPDPNFSISPAPTGDTTFVLYGQPGEYITQGGDIAFTQADGVNFIPSVNYDNGVSVTIDVYENGTFAERWRTDFAAPNDVPLAAGDEFAEASRFGFQATDVAGLSVAGDGRGCNNSTGEFHIYELSTNTIGQVDNFAADFRQSCDGGLPVVGGVRINSLVPATDPGFKVDPPAPADTTAPVAQANLIQTGRIKGTASSFIVSAVCTDENPGVELMSAEINGVSVSPGQKVRLVLSNRERVTTRKGKVTIASASITLTVSCVDAAGNTTVASVQPSYNG